jgi:hypothetical protein
VEFDALKGRGLKPRRKLPVIPKQRSRREAGDSGCFVTAANEDGAVPIGSGFHSTLTL